MAQFSPPEQNENMGPVQNSGQILLRLQMYKSFPFVIYLWICPGGVLFVCNVTFTWAQRYLQGKYSPLMCPVSSIRPTSFQILLLPAPIYTHSVLAECSRIGKSSRASLFLAGQLPQPIAQDPPPALRQQCPL